MTQQTHPVLFSPLTLRGLTLSNRIVVAPMSQFCAEDGCMTDWHLMHLGHMAISGAGLVMTEAVYPEARGRNGPGCVGLYSDACEAALARVHDFCRENSPATLGIQLGHAGRKASILPPWQDRAPIPPEAGGWESVGPSTISMGSSYPPPRALDRADMAALRTCFVEATERAARIGYDLLEIHAAHGYLFHQFLSPLSNDRVDAYGGNPQNRRRYLLEVFAAMRAVWPVDRPMGVRLSAVDWAEGGLEVEDAIAVARDLKDLGCDFIVASSGGLVVDKPIPVAPGYQVPFSDAIRREVDIPTVAIGMITEAEHAESIVSAGQADCVALARGMLYEPRWAWHAATALGVSDVSYPSQYNPARPEGRSAYTGNWTPKDLKTDRAWGGRSG
jgi:2,4-dienoyl-CoA reductase-like NADH-dependent reductase (Old Yellow Enzyme family)